MTGVRASATRRTPVTTGPFAFNPDPQAHSFRVFFAENLQTGQLGYTTAGRGLRRQLGDGAARLPRTSGVNGALAETEYDAQNWDAASPKFRNRLEGWRTGTTGSPPGLHNLVHLWIGGDMGPGDLAASGSPSRKGAARARPVWVAVNVLAPGPINTEIVGGRLTDERRPRWPAGSRSAGSAGCGDRRNGRVPALRWRGLHQRRHHPDRRRQAHALTTESFDPTNRTFDHMP